MLLFSIFSICPGPCTFSFVSLVRECSFFFCQNTCVLTEKKTSRLCENVPVLHPPVRATQQFGWRVRLLSPICQKQPPELGRGSLVHLESLQNSSQTHPEAHMCSVRWFCLNHRKIPQFQFSNCSVKLHLQFFGLCHNFQLGGVVFVAVGKNQPNICGKAVCVRVLSSIHLSLQTNRSYRLTNPSIKNQIIFLCAFISGSYFDRAEVHGVLDDVVVIV